MMKKILALCAVLCLMPLWGAYSLAEEAVPVRLGDGAPIVYFDGFTSDAVADPAALRGVTGAVDVSFYMDYAKYSNIQSIYELVNHTTHVQNIAATDDYLALFLRVEYDKEIPLPQGRMQYHLNRSVIDLPVLQDGEFVGVNAVVQEGYLLDDRTMACMIVYPLERPLDDAKPILLFPELTEQGGVEGGVRLRLDISQRHDPAAVVTPGLELATNPNAKESGSMTAVTRIACTPFGIRVVLSVLDDGRTGRFGYVMLDGEGRYLPQFSNRWAGHSLASAEHPQRIHNELWLLESTVPDRLLFAPIEAVESPVPQEFAHYIPFDAMPVDVTLDSGAQVHIEGVDVEADGYAMRYTMPVWGEIGWDIDLADVQGKRLGFNVVTIEQANLRTETLGYGGYWSEEYKGQAVARVTEEQIAQAAGIFLHGWEYGSRLLMDQAVAIDMK